jgi:hypothetical protein
MKRLFGTLALVAALVAAAAPGWADHGGQSCEQCATEEQHRHGGWRDKDDDKSHCPVTSKALEKAKFYLENADAIGLNEEQVRTIMAIKLDLKKAKYRQEAEMKIFELDVKAKMSEPKLDVEGLNAMLDTAGQGMATGAKAMVAQYAKLRAVLSEDQVKKAKEVWKKQQ